MTLIQIYVQSETGDLWEKEKTLPKKIAERMCEN